MDTQPRDSAGRYDEKPQSMAEARLPESAAPEEGSFLFPPERWESPEQYVRFWQTAPITDETLSSLAGAYAAERDLWVQDALATWARTFGNSKEARLFTAKMGRTKAEYETWWAENRKVEVERLKEVYPIRIPMQAMRGAARTLQMCSSWDGFTIEQKKAIASTVVYTPAEGDAMTAERMWQHYKLGSLGQDALLPGAGHQRLLQELHDEMAGLRRGV